MPRKKDLRDVHVEMHDKLCEATELLQEIRDLGTVDLPIEIEAKIDALMMPVFKVWKIQFSDRSLFLEAQRAVCAADIGHADMILTFNSKEGYDAARAGLESAGITQFTAEHP